MENILINKLLKTNPSTKQTFLGTFAIDTLPGEIEKYPCGMVINTDPISKPGQHWLALYAENCKKVEFFDSFGQAIPESVELFIKKHFGECEESITQVQDESSSACGAYCVYFLTIRCETNYSMQDIIASFHKDDYEANDVEVSEWLNDKFGQDIQLYDTDFH